MAGQWLRASCCPVCAAHVLMIMDWPCPSILLQVTVHDAVSGTPQSDLSSVIAEAQQRLDRGALDAAQGRRRCSAKARTSVGGAAKINECPLKVLWPPENVTRLEVTVDQARLM